LGNNENNKKSYEKISEKGEPFGRISVMEFQN